jgi:predicted  nucleic acid-binding Zn-ribbon protein
MQAADPENEYAPINPINADWVSLLDSDPAEAFRVRARLESQLDNSVAAKSFGQLAREISEARSRIRDIRTEIEELDAEEEELEFKISQMEGKLYQTGKPFAA